MFQSKTVIVIGAGASAELNIPVGLGLRQNIVSAVNIKFDAHGRQTTGNHELFDQIRAAYPNDWNNFVKAGSDIAVGIYNKNSIDEFMEWHKDDYAIVTLSKAAIVACILSEESRVAHAHFGDGNQFQPAGFDAKYYGKIFEMLTRGLNLSNSSDIFKNVKFVIFNYDRCLEYYFYQALKTMGLDENTARQICSNKDIFYHPYGVVSPIFEEGGFHFGADPRSANFVELSRNIETYSNNQDSVSIKSLIREAVLEASTLIFLGFSYNQTNLEYLKPQHDTKFRNIFGTTYELPKPNTENVKTDLMTAFNSEVVRTCPPDTVEYDRTINLSDQKCAEFLADFGNLILRSDDQEYQRQRTALRAAS